MWVVLLILFVALVLFCVGLATIAKIVCLVALIWFAVVVIAMARRN